MSEGELTKVVFYFVTHILRLLHSAQACGVVILLEAALAPVDLALSGESVDGFLGVTPWTERESAQRAMMPEEQTEAMAYMCETCPLEWELGWKGPS
jgi:hypothetical protein